jgi:hypothetical protein
MAYLKCSTFPTVVCVVLYYICIRPSSRLTNVQDFAPPSLLASLLQLPLDSIHMFCLRFWCTPSSGVHLPVIYVQVMREETACRFQYIIVKLQASSSYQSALLSSHCAFGRHQASEIMPDVESPRLIPLNLASVFHVLTTYYWHQHMRYESMI